MLIDQFGPSLRLSLLTFVLCGLAYPLAVTGMAQAAFPHQANGSLVAGKAGSKPLGSMLIGQQFAGPTWFHGRPSSIGYKAESSGASNLGPTSQVLADRVATTTAALHQAYPGAALPVDLLTTSGSGLDPDVTPAAAMLQVPRVAAARHLGEARVRALVEAHVQGRDLGLFGEPRVNVLALNLALAELR